jgi:DNA-binding transcriptional LysR family regulator
MMAADRPEGVRMLHRPDLNDLQILCAVVECGSFRAAADFVGTSQPTVSRAISRLEDRMGRPLVRRNSRSVAPTELGLRYADVARSLLRDFAETEASLLHTDELAGPISLTAPPAFGRRILVPVLAEFCARHPAVTLDVSLENRRVDLLEERVDVAIRFGPLTPTWRRQRLLLRGRYHLYASAERAAAVDGLGLDEVLEREPCLVLHSTHLRDRWPFATASGPRWVEVKPALTSDDVDTLIGFTREGAGVTLMPDFLVREEVHRGELVQLSRAAEAVPADVFTLTTEQRPATVNALLEHLVSSIGA